MKATIVSHEVPPQASSAEIHRFRFKLDDGTAPPLTESISLRTARVIVDNLPDGNAFIEMLQAIVKTQPDRYDALVGTEYPDHFNNNGTDKRRTTDRTDEGPRA